MLKRHNTTNHCSFSYSFLVVQRTEATTKSKKQAQHRHKDKPNQMYSKPESSGGGIDKEIKMGENVCSGEWWEWGKRTVGKEAMMIAWGLQCFLF